MVSEIQVGLAWGEMRSIGTFGAISRGLESEMGVGDVFNEERELATTSVMNSDEKLEGETATAGGIA